VDVVSPADGTRTRRTTAALGAVGALLVTVLVLGGAAPASACSCDSQVDVVAEAVAVFTGAAEPPEVEGAGRHLFVVDQVFKGDVHERQWVYEASGACGATFSSTEPHLVVAVWRHTDEAGEKVAGDDLSMSSCLASTPLAEGLPDGLGPARAPLPGTSPGPDSGTSGWKIVAAVAALVVVVAAGTAGVAGLWRRWRAMATR
jgi:hypothetical protein